MWAPARFWRSARTSRKASVLLLAHMIMNVFTALSSFVWPSILSAMRLASQHKMCDLLKQACGQASNTGRLSLVCLRNTKATHAAMIDHTLRVGLSLIHI